MKFVNKYNEKSLYNHLKELFPICRSITGNGIRETLSYFEKYHQELQRISFKTGTKVLDWEIPKEWNIKDGYIQNIETGENMLNLKK